MAQPDPPPFNAQEIATLDRAHAKLREYLGAAGIPWDERTRLTVGKFSLFLGYIFHQAGEAGMSDEALVQNLANYLAYVVDVETEDADAPGTD
jgi:hypothetical protein